METPLDKALVGNQKNLPKHLRDAIEAAPETPVKMIRNIIIATADPMLGSPSCIWNPKNVRYRNVPRMSVA